MVEMHEILEVRDLIVLPHEGYFFEREFRNTLRTNFIQES